MKIPIATIFIAITLQANCQVDFIMNARCNEAYQEILSLKFDEARENLYAEQIENPENVYVDYLENYIDFLSVFISGDETLFDTLEKNKSKRIDRVEKLAPSSPYRNFILGNINLQWAFARLKFGEYFTAAFEVKKAYRLLTKNEEDFPDFLPNNITLGVLHIIIDLAPDKFDWLLKLINMEGSIELGKAELNLVLHESMENEEYAYLKNEALFYLGYVELNIFPDEDKLSYLLAQLEDDKTDNLMLSYLTIKILMRTGNNDKVLEKFDQLPDLNAYYPFYVLQYLEAECRLRRLETKNASKHYLSFIEKFKGQNFIKDAYRKLGWIALLNNDTLQYKYLMFEVQHVGQTKFGQDIEAEYEAQTGRIPDAEFLMSRLFFDGGYYKKSDSILLALSDGAMTNEELIELNYRKASIANQLQQYQSAKIFYKETIDLGKDSPRYFAGKSALELGEIYESDLNFEQAAYYYKLCLDLDFNEYESGIHIKAKAGLKRVKV